MAVVDGRLQLRDWKDKDGNKRRSAEIVVNRVYFGEGKKSSEPQNPENPGGFTMMDDDSDPPFYGGLRYAEQDHQRKLM